MTETQQRFLRAIAERVPSDQVVEVHLFPPIRQGGVETGVAVVAEDPRTRTPASVPVTAEANGTEEVVSVQRGQHADDEPQAAASAVEVAEIDDADNNVAALKAGLFVIIDYHVIGWPDGHYEIPTWGGAKDTYDSNFELALSFWDEATGGWSTASGTYQVYVGDSSDAPLETTFQVAPR